MSSSQGRARARAGEEEEVNEPSSVVDDVLDDTSDVTVPLGKVESSESRRLLSVVRVGLDRENEDNSSGARGRKKASARPFRPPMDPSTARHSAWERLDRLCSP